MHEQKLTGYKTANRSNQRPIGVNPIGGRGYGGSQPPAFGVRGDVEGSWGLHEISYDIQEYEMKTLSKVVIFQKIESFVY